MKRLPACEQWRAAQKGGSLKTLPIEQARAAFDETFVTGSARIDAHRFFWAAYHGQPMPPLDGPIG
ncbi:hypothetical protein [Lysobacter sp. FW306-1B-D06B]|uniref:hypothetical protein n=1 Tax=Lysobacter sp. FW306-1B-D06B TaxID=3140250 RepID=UPI0031402F55